MPRKSDAPPVPKRKPILGKGWPKPLDPRVKLKMLPRPVYGSENTADYLRHLDAYMARAKEIFAAERALKREDARKAKEERERKRKPAR